MIFSPEQLAIPLDRFEQIQKSVAAELSGQDFPAVMPENDLRPDPAVLRDQLVALRLRVDDLDETMDRLCKALNYERRPAFSR